MTDQETGESGGMDQMYNIHTREELEAASPQFPVTGILDCYAFNPELEINLAQPACLEKLNELYTEENVPLFRAYLLYHQVYIEKMERLDEESYREYQKLDREFEGVDEDVDDETAARELTETYLSQFVDEMYVKKYCTEEMREDILSLMRDIIEEYREMLQEETWLTKETRDKAIKKLDTMALGAVYPTSREDWSGYTFRSRAEGGNYLEANTELWRCQLEMKRKNSFGKPDSGLWKETASTANGIYIPETNTICICGGMLDGDMYHKDMTREELLAGAGTFIAHEISHAFDSYGAQFDETGALKGWWTDADTAAFERRTDKLIAYYDSMHPWKDGSAYSGAVVQEEAVADLGSMACILRMAEKEEDFDYDAFFRTFAHRWRSKIKPAAFEKAYSTNIHPIDHLRVNVVVAQFPEFQKTYDIQPGDGMYVAPEDRIAIWGMPDNTAQD